MPDNSTRSTVQFDCPGAGSGSLVQANGAYRADHNRRDSLYATCDIKERGML
jgi:hypothetical protein